MIFPIYAGTRDRAPWSHGYSRDFHVGKLYVYTFSDIHYSAHYYRVRSAVPQHTTPGAHTGVRSSDLPPSIRQFVLYSFALAIATYFMRSSATYDRTRI